MVTTLAIDGGSVRLSETSISYSPLGTFHAGQRHCVVGRNGSGKSTLARCVSGVIPEVYTGTVKLRGEACGRAIFGKTDYRQPSHVGVLPQESREFLLGLDLSEEWSALRLAFNAVCSNDDRERIFRECRLAELVGRSSWALSDGEKQRLAMAILLAGGFAWLVLDEWASHLDDYWLSFFHDLLSELVKDKGQGTIELCSQPQCPDADTRRLSSHASYRGSARDVTPCGERLAALEELLRAYCRKDKDRRDIRLLHHGRLRSGGFKKDINTVEVHRGQTALVTGRNGSGKTTLLRGVRLSRRWPRWRRPFLVFADPQLQMVGADLQRMLVRCMDAARTHDLTRAVTLLCRTLDVPVERDPLELNHASAKLLAVVLATVGENPGLLVDEPFVSLDPDTARLVARCLSFATSELGKCVVIACPQEPRDELLKHMAVLPVGLD